MVFEGPHGTGKTTQAKRLTTSLKSRGVAALYTKEPFMRDIRRLVRRQLVWGDTTSGYTLALLHAADRYNHVNFVKEEMRRGECVISDRYLASGVVYQSLQGVPVAFIEEANSFCIEPDATFFLDAHYRVRKERILASQRRRRNGPLPESLLKSEGDRFREVFEIHSQRWKNVFLVDCNRGEKVIFCDIESGLSELKLFDT